MKYVFAPLGFLGVTVCTFFKGSACQASDLVPLDKTISSWHHTLSQELVRKIGARHWFEENFSYKKSCSFRPSLRIRLDINKLTDDLAHLYTASFQERDLIRMIKVVPDHTPLNIDNPNHLNVLIPFARFVENLHSNPGQFLLKQYLVLSEPEPASHQGSQNERSLSTPQTSGRFPFQEPSFGNGDFLF